MSAEEIPRPSVFQKTSENRMRLVVCPTTGGYLEVSVSPQDTVESLKCNLARRLKVHEQKLSLLYRNRILKNGSLIDNQLMNGSKITLLPNLESGTVNMTPDARVMQALENLSDTQVNDFLTGRSPLLLAMKLGEHMMFVQLQLSAASCNNRRSRPVAPPSQHTNVSNGATSAASCCQKMQEGPKEPAPATPGTLPHGAGVTSGAVIDSVSHLGRGVYSGTFSGTLDASVQDTSGRPKRDITTILHILNDLLEASPQFRQQVKCMHHSPAASSSTGVQESLGHFNQSSPVKEEANENTELRGKVRRLQRMLEERKQRRQERRGTRVPYMWQDRLTLPKMNPMDRQKQFLKKQFEQTRRDTLTTKPENHPGNEAGSFGAPATNIEQESVYV